MRQRSASLDAPGAHALLERAWEAVVGGPAPAQAVALLTAQWALETDTGRSMPGHNFAGVKAGPTAPGASFRTVEGHGAGQREVTARFRVYDSAVSGAHDYVQLLAHRYPAALAAARSGDTAGFSHALAAGGYFTADPHEYEAGLERRLAELADGNGISAPSGAASAPPRSSPGLGEGALLGVLRSLSRDPDSA